MEKNMVKVGILWQSRGYNSKLSLTRAWAPSLLRELRSHKACSMAQKRENNMVRTLQRGQHGAQNTVF